MKTKMTIIVRTYEGAKAAAMFDAELSWNALDAGADISGLRFGVPLQIEVHGDRWSYLWTAPYVPEGLWERIKWAITGWWQNILEVHDRGWRSKHQR